MLIRPDAKLCTWGLPWIFFLWRGDVMMFNVSVKEFPEVARQSLNFIVLITQNSDTVNEV